MSNLQKLSYRELIIQQRQDVKNLCRSFDEFKEANTDDHVLVNEKIDKLVEKKVSNRLFYFTISIIVSGLILLTAYAGTLKNDVVDNRSNIRHIQKAVDRYHYFERGHGGKRLHKYKIY